jgi:hypothetical protein
MSSIIPHHTLIEKRCWKLFSTVPCGLSWDHRCKLCVLLIQLQVKVASSVNSINGSNWRLVCNQWQNSIHMALSLGCRFCTCCGWIGHTPSSCNVRHTCVCETPRQVESLRVLVVGLCCTISRMFSCSSSCCWHARSYGISTGKHTTFMQSIEHLGKHSTI